jgi:hypothetical protein
MIGIDCIAPIENSNQLQNGAGSARGLALYSLASWILGRQTLPPIHAPRLSATKNRLEIRAGARFFGFLAEPRRKADERSKGACARVARAAARRRLSDALSASETRQQVERLISEGLLRWGNGSRTFVSSPNGDEP